MELVFLRRTRYLLFCDIQFDWRVVFAGSSRVCDNSSKATVEQICFSTLNRIQRYRISRLLWFEWPMQHYYLRDTQDVSCIIALKSIKAFPFELKVNSFHSLVKRAHPQWQWRWRSSVQYTTNGVKSYEWVFGETFLSTGGVRTTESLLERILLPEMHMFSTCVVFEVIHWSSHTTSTLQHMPLTFHTTWPESRRFAPRWLLALYRSRPCIAKLTFAQLLHGYFTITHRLHGQPLVVNRLYPPIIGHITTSVISWTNWYRQELCISSDRGSNHRETKSIRSDLVFKFMSLCWSMPICICQCMYHPTSGQDS